MKRERTNITSEVITHKMYFPVFRRHMNQIWIALSYKRTVIICLDMKSLDPQLDKTKQQIYKSIRHFDAFKNKRRHENFEGEYRSISLDIYTEFEEIMHRTTHKELAEWKIFPLLLR